MSDLVWSIKNGDLESVKDFFDNKVSHYSTSFTQFSLQRWIPTTNFSRPLFCVFFLLQNFNVNEEINGRKCLHYAADYGQTEVLAYLISRGAVVDDADKHGITPLLAAIWEGHTACVKMLIEAGAQKTGACPDGSTYMDAAANSEIRALLA